MLKNAYLDAKIGVDPAENEAPKECCVVAVDAGPQRGLQRAGRRARRGHGAPGPSDERAERRGGGPAAGTKRLNPS